MHDVATSATLDTSGKCRPMPVAEINRAIRGVAVRRNAGDPGARTDIPSRRARTGNSLPKTERTGGYCASTSTNMADENELCGGCLYYPPNLPKNAYSVEDWAMLQARHCSFLHVPGSAECLDIRKTSCSLADLTRPRD